MWYMTDRSAIKIGGEMKWMKTVVVGSVIVLAGCQPGTKTEAGRVEDQTGKEIDKVDENTGQTGHYLAATGQESFGLDVCNELTKEWIGEKTGLIIGETKDFSNNSGTGCEYYPSDNPEQYVTVVVSYLEAENQKKGQEFLGRSLIADPRIPMDHFIAVQEDGQTVNGVYLVLDPKKFVRVDRSSTKVIDDQGIVNLGVEVAKFIKPVSN